MIVREDNVFAVSAAGSGERVRVTRSVTLRSSKVRDAKTMRETGRDMKAAEKRATRGALALNVTGC